MAEAVGRRERSARENIAAALQRVAAVNPGLNAFVYVDGERALAEAEALDARLATGEAAGPLAGVPIAVKDTEPVAGMPWTLGARAFAGRIAEHDSVQVARLKAAGAIVLGKTNTPELAYKGFTVNALFGATRNPWDPAKTPGGSSGGSAVAVATGMTPLATASDGGGSIRIPAAFCGCYGIKPTNGRIPIGGEEYPHWGMHSTPGPLAWTVRDAARYLDLASGAHPDDLHSLDRPAGGYEDAVCGPLPRLGRLAWSGDFGYAGVNPEVIRVARAAAQALADALGAELVETHPGFEDPMPTWYALGAPGDAAFIDTLTDEQQALLEPGFVRFADTAREYLATQTAVAQQERHALNRRMTAFFGQYDLLLTPTCADTPFAAEGPPPRVIGGKEVGATGFIPFTYPFNVTGHPAASAPAGLAANGLPVGLQIVGPRYDDLRVLQASAVYEAACPWPRPA